MLASLRLILRRESRNAVCLAGSCVSGIKLASLQSSMPDLSREACSARTPGTCSSSYYMPQHPLVRFFANSEDDGSLKPTHSSGMSEHEFHRAVDSTLDVIQDRIEAYIEDLEVPDSDIEYGMGVLTVKLGQKGTFVINKQTPNRQIWLSSPVSGPFRYDYIDEKWVYHRDGSEMLKKLEEEFESLFNEKLDLRS